MAVRTQHCLQVITTHSIPFRKRTIWLIKILALIVGAGGVLGVAAQLGLPWFLAVLLAGPVIFFALRENVKDVIPPKPVQDASAHVASWQQYRHIRNAYLQSWKWFGAAFLMLLVSAALANRLPGIFQTGLLSISLAAMVGSVAVMYVKHLRWIRWACPRCGCAFRGFWGRPWLPKSCVYCGLLREDSANPQRADID